MNNYHSIIGERIRTARADFDITQEELAARIGSAKSSIALWESGKGNPRKGALRTVAKFFRKPVSYFTGNPRDDVPTLADLDSAPSNPFAVDKEEDEENPFAVDKEPEPEDAPSEKFLVKMLNRQQNMLARQQEIMADQRKDTARLTEVMAHQQELLGKQQDLLAAERNFQQQITLSHVDKLTKTVEELRAQLNAQAIELERLKKT